MGRPPGQAHRAALALEFGAQLMRNATIARAAAAPRRARRAAASGARVSSLAQQWSTALVRSSSRAPRRRRDRREGRSVRAFRLGHELRAGEVAHQAQPRRSHPGGRHPAAPPPAARRGEPARPTRVAPLGDRAPRVAYPARERARESAERLAAKARGRAVLGTKARSCTSAWRGELGIGAGLGASRSDSGRRVEWKRSWASSPAGRQSRPRPTLAVARNPEWKCAGDSGAEVSSLGCRGAANSVTWSSRGSTSRAGTRHRAGDRLEAVGEGDKPSLLMRTGVDATEHQLDPAVVRLGAAEYGFQPPGVPTTLFQWRISLGIPPRSAVTAARSAARTRSRPGAHRGRLGRHAVAVAGIAGR